MYCCTITWFLVEQPILDAILNKRTGSAVTYKVHSNHKNKFECIPNAHKCSTMTNKAAKGWCQQPLDKQRGLQSWQLSFSGIPVYHF